jgi:hypothetical protein
MDMAMRNALGVIFEDEDFALMLPFGLVAARVAEV